ncbi:SET domain-containing protein-lysine N-methyltransferase [bacterium]|nr:SET domain-containing protein-lysine N-methyltransferase [bacterium]
MKDISRQINECTLDIDDIINGRLIPYSEVIGSDSILNGGDKCSFEFEYNGQTYFVEDRYCPNPACLCNEVNLAFLKLIIIEDGEDALVSDYFTASFSFQEELKIKELLGAQNSDAKAILSKWYTLYPNIIDEFKKRNSIIKDIAKRSLKGKDDLNEIKTNGQAQQALSTAAIDDFNTELEDFPVMITDIPKKGRGVIAKKNIAAGTILLKEKPEIVVRVEGDIDIISVVESTFLQLIELPQEKFYSVLKKLCCLYPTNQTNAKQNPTKYVNEFEADKLYLIVEKIMTDNIIPSNKMLDIRTMVGLPNNSSNILLILVILRLTMTGIFDKQEREREGEALAVITSFFNHSCFPNSSILFHHRLNEYEIIANRNIKKGEEIFFTYIALYQYTNERRDELMYNYGFHCDCPRCQKDLSCPSELDLMPPIIQTNLTDTQKDDKSDFLEQLYHETEQQYYTEFISGDKKHTRSINMANEWLKHSEGFYAPLHPYFFKLTEFLGRTYCEVEEYDKAIKYFEKSIQIMDKVFPEFWFRKSCSLSSLGKIYRHIGQIEKAQKIEERSQRLLLITRGQEYWDDGSSDICNF